MTPTPTPQQIRSLVIDAGFNWVPYTNEVYPPSGPINDAITRLVTLALERFGQAPAVPQEPVAVRHRKTEQLESAAVFAEPYNWGDRSEWEFLYTHPAPAEVREPLSERESIDLLDSALPFDAPEQAFLCGLRLAEKHHGITGIK